MTLKEKKFEVRDADGNRIDMSNQQDAPVLINGKDNKVRLEHVFKKFELDEDEGIIYGTSLLSYFTVADGKLVDKEGNTVELLTTEGKPILIVDNTEEPFFDDDVEIDFEYVQAFSQLIGINKPDEIFAQLLSDEEKALFTTEREAREADANTKKKAKEKVEAEVKQKQDEAKELADKETALAESKKKADEEARAKVDPQYFVDEKKYKKHHKFYTDEDDGLEWKEYVVGNVHLFYGKDWAEIKEDPFVLVKRGDNWWEDCETDVDNITEDEKTVQIEFVDGEEKKKITLDLEKGEISVSGVDKE